MRASTRTAPLALALAALPLLALTQTHAFSLTARACGSAQSALCCASVVNGSAALGDALGLALAPGALYGLACAAQSGNASEPCPCDPDAAVQQAVPACCAGEDDSGDVAGLVGTNCTLDLPELDLD